MSAVTERWRSERVTAAIYHAGVKHDGVATVGAWAMWGDNRLHCLPDPRMALGEITCVLSPGGTVRGTACVAGRGPRKDASIWVLRRGGVFGNAPRTGDIEQGLR